jgi:hypothetical protein
MALVVNTNSYVTAVDADLYFETRIDSANWNSSTDSNKDAALVTATRIIDNNAWIGNAVSSTQALGFPRKNAIYYDYRLGLQVTIGDSVIPDLVKNAVYEQALHLINNEDLLEGITQNFETISVGSISLSDSNNDIGKISITPAFVMKPIRPLIRHGQTTGMGYSWWRAN